MIGFKNKLWLLAGLVCLAGCQKHESLLGPNGTVTRGELLQRVTIAGTVIPFRRTIITAPYNGYVRKVFVKIGDKIKQGDPITSVSQSLQSTDAVFPMRAPYAGTVMQVEKSEGEYIKEGDTQNFIARIDDTSKLLVLAYAPEIDRVKMRVGQEALIKASAILDRSYKGIVRELALAARDNGTNRNSQVDFAIRTEVIDPDEQLSPGMSVIIDIIANKKTNVLQLKHEFIQKENNKYFVTLSNGTKQAVEVGMQNEEAMEIVSGLKEGDRVVPVDFSAINKVD